MIKTIYRLAIIQGKEVVETTVRFSNLEKLSKLWMDWVQFKSKKL